MTSGIEAKRDGEHVAIVVQAGEKRARLKVTPEYARALAAELLHDADGSKATHEELRAIGDRLRGATSRGRIEEMLKGALGDFGDLFGLGKGPLK